MVETRNIVKEVVPLSKKFAAHIYKHANLQQLSDEEEDAIYATLIRISSLSFGADQTKFWKSKKEEFNYLRELTYFVFVEEIATGEIVGWTGIKIFKFKRQTACYLDSSGIIPTYYGNGIVPKANAIISKRAFLKRPLFDFVMFTRTENPIIYKALVRNLGSENVYPRIDGVPYPEKYQPLVDFIAEYLNQSHLMKPQSLLMKNAYGYLDELYGELPKSSDPTLNDFFESHLSSNDAFLIMGVLNYKTFIKLKL